MIKRLAFDFLTGVLFMAVAGMFIVGFATLLNVLSALTSGLLMLTLAGLVAVVMLTWLGRSLRSI